MHCSSDETRQPSLLSTDNRLPQCVCVYVNVYGCVYVCHVNLHVFVCVSFRSSEKWGLHVCMCVRDANVRVYECVCGYVHECVCVLRVCVCVRARAHVS